MMTNKSDYFFLNIKQMYSGFGKPAQIDEEIWAEVWEPFELEDIHKALKSYRKGKNGQFVPTVAQFKEYLYPYEKRVVKDDLPLSPERYLMEEDIKRGQCKYLFPVYVKAVDYVFNVKVKEAVGEKVFRDFTLGKKYRTAVDYGLFADFDKILDMVYAEGKKHEQGIAKKS
jgi:hypothetical protein